MIRPVPMMLVYGNYDMRLVFKIGDRLWRVREVGDKHVDLKTYLREPEDSEYFLLPYDDKYKWVGEKVGTLQEKRLHGWDKLWRANSVIRTVMASSWRLVSPIEEREITLSRWAID